MSQEGDSLSCNVITAALNVNVNLLWTVSSRTCNLQYMHTVHISTFCLQKTFIGYFYHFAIHLKSLPQFLFFTFDQMLQHLKEGRDRMAFSFASHKSILLLKPLWASMTARHLLSPPAWLMRKPLHQPVTSGFVRLLTIYKHKEQGIFAWHPVTVLQQANGCSQGSVCLCSSSSEPVFYLPRLCSTSANCLHTCVYVCVYKHIWPPVQRVYVEVWMCSAEQSRAVLFFMHAYWRRQQRPRWRLWGAQVPHSLFPLFFFSVIVSPPNPAQSKLFDSSAEAKAAQLSRFEQGRNKASSSWTIL